MNDTNYQGQNTNDTQTQPMGTQTQDQQTPHPQQNMKIDDKAVAKMVGDSIAQVDGVLGINGGLTDMLKSNDDRRRVSPSPCWARTRPTSP